jgi:hypothetical protein
VPTAIFRDGIRRLVQEEGAQLVDVLPREEYEEAFRPNEPVGTMAKRMQDREATAVLVTTSDGRLVGLLYQEDTEQLACRRETCRPKPWIGCCSTISPHRRHEMNQYPGVTPPCNRGFGTRSRSTE